MNWPLAFVEFMKENGIQEEDYDETKDLPRYLRVKSSSHKISDLQLEFGDSLEVVNWFPNFYRLDGSVKIVSSPSFIAGLIYGMDIASAVAVHALSVSPNDHVLDLCCAPGGKLCYISDLQGSDALGTVTGVDLTPHRLHTCKRICQKYKLSRYRLFAQDGTTFNVHAPSRVGRHCTFISENLEQTLVKPLHESKLIRNDPQWKHASLLYDKVIVDAECTHDGSIAHMWKHEQLDWADFSKVLHPERLKKLQGLQRGLLENGYRMLKPGGIVVYSTCSFSRKQNEDIIAWFLDRYPDALLEEIPDAQSFPKASLVSPSPEYKPIRKRAFSNEIFS